MSDQAAGTGILERLVSGTRQAVPRILPGMLVAVVLAIAATFLSEHYGGPTMLFALLLGIAFNFLSGEGKCAPGIEFSSRTVLRLGVALLGVRISVDQILNLGFEPIAIVVFAVAVTTLSGLVFARLCGRGWRFGILTGGAVAICGASAALALAAVLPKNEFTERNSIFTVIAVTTLSTVAMILYPLIVGAFSLDAQQAGIFLGGTIHDVAQVVGAGYSMSEQTGDTATFVKLLRVSMLAPVILTLSLVFRNANASGGKKAFPLPAFVIAFAALVVANSLGLVPTVVQEPLVDLSRWCLVSAIAAIGMKTSLGAMAKLGFQHIAVVIGETLLLAGMVLFLVIAL
jgi:uncharacterized integral membrane protein (TIGR00698 family)